MATSSKMLSCGHEGQKDLQLIRECEALLTAFILNMRVQPDVVAKGPGMSTAKGKEPTESSVDVIDQKRKDLLRIVEKIDVHIPEVEGGRSLAVPTTLPTKLRADPATVEQGDIAKLYDLPSAMQYVHDGELTEAEVVALHLKSFRNIILYELSDADQLKRRFIRFFAGLLMDLVELCYPNKGDSKLVRTLLYHAWNEAVMRNHIKYVRTYVMQFSQATQAIKCMQLSILLSCLW